MRFFRFTQTIMKYTNINSILYNELFLLGGDGLIAVYSLLRFHKNKEVKYYKEGVNIYQTLKEKTDLSVTTLRKYIKELTKLGLCRFDSVGNFCLLGTSKVNKKYTIGKRVKLVKVEVGTFAETKLYSFRVRVWAMENAQKKRIDRRDRLNKIIERAKKGYLLNKFEKRSLKNVTDFDKEYQSGLKTFTAKTVLSNEGFSKLKFGENKSKGSGRYWRNKLVSAGIIKTRRVFHFIKKCSHKEYLYMKYNIDISVVYKRGKLFKELVPEFTTSSFPIPLSVEEIRSKK